MRRCLRLPVSPCSLRLCLRKSVFPSCPEFTLSPSKGVFVVRNRPVLTPAFRISTFGFRVSEQNRLLEGRPRCDSVANHPDFELRAKGWLPPVSFLPPPDRSHGHIDVTGARPPKLRISLSAWSTVQQLQGQPRQSTATKDHQTNKPKTGPRHTGQFVSGLVKDFTCILNAARCRSAVLGEGVFNCARDGVPCVASPKQESENFE